MEILGGVFVMVEYQDRIANETRHFEGGASYQGLPPMHGWWSARFLRPRTQELFGITEPDQFYVGPIARKCEAEPDRIVRVASIGSGNGMREIAFTRKLLAGGQRNFRITGYELSAELTTRSNAMAREMGLDGNLGFESSDINSGLDEPDLDVCIANQVLHHIVDLEALFDGLRERLREDGLLLTRDMIGRNGHQAWPEAKEIIDEIWGAMPKRYRMNNRLKRVQATFPDTDFARNSFEGIRAQDIQRLLNERFGYTCFYAYGGIVERFVNRAFGGNFDPANEDDQAFVTQLNVINDLAIDSGWIRPTQMMGYFTKDKTATGAHWKNRTPANAVRATETG